MPCAADENPPTMQTTHRGIKFGILAFLAFAAGAAYAKNFGALDVEPKGTAVSNGTKMSVVWRFFRQEEILKADSETDDGKTYALSGVLSHKKTGEMKIAERVEKLSPERTRFCAEAEILGKPPRGAPLTPSFQFHLAKDIFEGRIFADGNVVAPDTKNTTARELRVQSGNGELKISGNLKINFRDTVRQKVLNYRTVSLMFDELGGGKYSADFTLEFDKDKKPVPLPREYVVRESDDYAAFESVRIPEKGGALDFSFLLDAPAGKYGFVKVRGADYYFEKSPDKKVRFFGENICQNATVPEKAQAVALADELAAAGFNAARLHQTSMLLRGSPTDSAVLNQRQMDKFDFLFAELKKRGIYTTIDFYATGRLYPHEYDDVKYRGDNMKALFFLSDKARATLKRFVSNFLEHKNPYTGLAYKNEPAIIFASVVNEDAMGNVRNFVIRTHLDYDIAKPVYEKWLAERGGLPEAKTDNDRFQLFLIDRYGKFYDEMAAHIKSVAPNMLLTDQTNGGSLMVSAMSRKYDVADLHTYTWHPLFFENRFSLPMYVDASDPIAKKGGMFAKICPLLPMTKPANITEWDFVRPNPKAALGGVFVGAYSALNGIDGLWHFCYTHGKNRIQNNERLGMFETAGDAVRMLSNKIGAMIYLRGDIRESKTLVPLVVSPTIFEDGNADARESAGIAAEVSLVAKSAVVVAKSARSAAAKLPRKPVLILLSDKNADAADTPPDVKAVYAFDENAARKAVENCKFGGGKIGGGVYLSSTKQLFLDSGKSQWKAVSPRSEIFAQNGGAKLDGKFAQVENTRGWSVVAVCSLEKTPLEKSPRILVAHLTDLRNTSQRFANENFDILLDYGKLPYLLKRADSEITFNSPLDAFECLALDGAGKPVAQVPIERVGGKSKIKISTHNKFGATIAYLLRRK